MLFASAGRLGLRVVPVYLVALWLSGLAVQGIAKDAAAKKAEPAEQQITYTKHIAPLLWKNCADCHQSVDLSEGSAAALRKQVDPQLCAGCHSGGVKGAKELFVQ